ncbi:TRAM domain-containing protein [Halorientalis pallida]|uniref:TRAM domain-containing protein n=1 Tax=Halorientalis pallida TaxID=2479928 RepID=A0A498KVX5_9EURY|nr:TRAM domain-containing protein [Halorientalis pallida]RXK47869.1 TRAM domain-containing protein [Halorientalis pallida]
MDIPDQLRCLFSASVENRNDPAVIEIPEQEVQSGEVQPGKTYCVAVLAARTVDETTDTDATSQSTNTSQTPPVEKGEQRTIEIEDLGNQGDGITRVERGFVIIVPESKQDERVTIDITDVQRNVAFAEVVERLDYYE